jgi:hypothetical protein
MVTEDDFSVARRSSRPRSIISATLRAPRKSALRSKSTALDFQSRRCGGTISFLTSVVSSAWAHRVAQGGRAGKTAFQAGSALDRLLADSTVASLWQVADGAGRGSKGPVNDGLGGPPRRYRNKIGQPSVNPELGTKWRRTRIEQISSALPSLAEVSSPRMQFVAVPLSEVAQGPVSVGSGGARNRRPQRKGGAFHSLMFPTGPVAAGGMI